MRVFTVPSLARGPGRANPPPLAGLTDAGGRGGIPWAAGFRRDDAARARRRLFRNRVARRRRRTYVAGNFPGGDAVTDRTHQADVRNIRDAARLSRARREGRPAGGFMVRIVYTEPEFQRRVADAPPFFTADFDCSGAADPDEAVRRALHTWDWYACNSRVGWRRIIQSIEVFGIRDA
jgi:hypothetical protein